MLGVIELGMQELGVIQEKHVEVLLQVLMSLRLSEIVSLLLEVAWLVTLSLAESPSTSVESLQEGVAEEGGRVLSKVHVRLVSIVED